MIFVFTRNTTPKDRGLFLRRGEAAVQIELPTFRTTRQNPNKVNVLHTNLMAEGLLLFVKEAVKLMFSYMKAAVYGGI